MSDTYLRGLQFQHLVGEFFAPLLGRTPENWEEVHHMVVKRMFKHELWRERIQTASSYSSFERRYQFDWLDGMCKLLDVSTPSAEESLELVGRANACITRSVRAAIPGAVNALRILYEREHILYTASGQSSIDLAGYLEGMGVLEFFHRLYGPDLIGTFKDGPEYYERIFADVNVIPSDALVVDDKVYAVDWAEQAGAHAILVSPSPHPTSRKILTIKSLADLPEIINCLG